MPRIYTKTPPETRFWKFVDKTDTCWLWTGGFYKLRTGAPCYGAFNIGQGNKITGAHRFSWSLVNGPITDDLCILHKCDVMACVRPDHLFLGTRDDNNKDMQAKGRCDRVQRAKGINHGHAVLSDADVVEIRLARAGGEIYRTIAARYGINLATIAKICTRALWKHIP